MPTYPIFETHKVSAIKLQYILGSLFNFLQFFIGTGLNLGMFLTFF